MLIKVTGLKPLDLSITPFLWFNEMSDKLQNNTAPVYHKLLLYNAGQLVKGCYIFVFQTIYRERLSQRGNRTH